MLLLIPSLWAQELSFMECTYSMRELHYLNNGRIRKDEMTLRIGRTSSAFFSRWNWEGQAIADSLFARGASIGEVQNARKKAGLRVSILKNVIYKNYPEPGKITQTDEVGIGQYFRCTEEMLTPDWEITGEREDVLGYSCQKAVVRDYYGRDWTAWFTTEIPVPNGPWKLHGLPGLILKAEDAEGHFTFTCIAIKEAKNPIEPRKERYIECTKEEYVKQLKAYETNDTDYSRKRGLAVAVPITEDYDTYVPPSNEFNYIER